MSNEIRELRYAVTVADSEHWPSEARDQAEESDTGSYSDWVIQQLDDAMRKAGAQFVTEHPDLFVTELT